jgi:outer membrane protein OmpA-like peptidoglycan-associated protein
MAEDWLADVRKYVADADEKVVKGIIRYCGIALQKVDSSLVAFSDKKETDRVRENYLKKKLGLTHSDGDLDAAIAAVGQRMKADRTKNRVTVYYLLAEHFGSLGIFGGATGKAATAVPAAAAAAVAAATAPLAAMASSAPVAVPSADMAAAPAAAAAVRGPLRPDDGIFGWGCLIAAVVFGCIIAAACLAWFMTRTADAPVAAPVPAAAVPAPAPVAATPAPAVPIPTGSGAIGEERNGKPMLTVYFDTGKSAVTKDFAMAAAKVKKYVADNPGSKLAVSGFNDPTGNAAANAALSKRRAEQVGKELAAIGIPAAAIELVKPAAATDASGDNTNARRVEVVIQ